jgi:Domain of unknown function (DUF4258)
MDLKAAKALATIRQCVEADRVIVLRHFRQRLAARFLLWADVLAVLDAPDDVRDEGRDRYGRPKWVVAGPGADGHPLESVCVLETDDKGDVTVFVTIY